MSWMPSITTYCHTCDYDEITVCSKDGHVSETTLKDQLPSSHYSALTNAPMGKVLKVYDDKFMLVNMEDGIKKFKGSKGFIAIDRLRGTGGDGTYYVLVRSCSLAPGKVTNGLSGFSKWLEDSGRK